MTMKISYAIIHLQGILGALTMSEKGKHKADLSDEILKRAAELTPSELRSLLAFVQKMIRDDEKKMKVENSILSKNNRRI